EDGIRDYKVTGVQTCALPILAHMDEIGFRVTAVRDDGSLELEPRGGFIASLFEAQPALVHTDKGDVAGVFMPRDTGFTHHTAPRSEERRVGKECRSWWSPDDE